jgi:hypothetical protein
LTPGGRQARQGAGQHSAQQDDAAHEDLILRQHLMKRSHENIPPWFSHDAPGSAIYRLARNDKSSSFVGAQLNGQWDFRNDEWEM